jgi:SOS-response transcriptional repressor LexA
METNNKITQNSTHIKRSAKLGVRDTGKLFAYLVNYKQTHDGNSPSIREIMNHFKVSSSSVVAYLLGKLEAENLINIDGYPNGRSIKIVGAQWIPPEDHDSQRSSI